MTGGKPTDALEVLESVSRTLNRAEVQMKAAKASAGGWGVEGVESSGHTFTRAGCCEDYTKVILNMHGFFNRAARPLFF